MNRLLILDDDHSIIDVLKNFSDLMGYRCIAFSSALVFFDNYDCKKDDILLLDLRMPEMDGIEVMRNIAQQPIRPQIILMSGTDKSILHSAEQYGEQLSLNIIGTVYKPITLEKLKQIIDQDVNSEKNKFNSNETINFTLAELEEAILDKQMILYYQPQISIEKNTIVGVEGLVRWHHPNKGIIYPNQFIHLLEENGLIADLTTNIINQALTDSKTWSKNNLPINVSVNVSAQNITSLTLPEQLVNLLKCQQLTPSLLTIEITESSLANELATSLDVLTRLRLKGVKLAIDDFGTGYSSLSQLHKIPFTELKIDRSFVMNMCDDNEANSIVKTCIKLGQELNMNVVAEGVENKAILKKLKTYNCDIAQGYYFAKAMPFSELLNWSITYNS